MIIEYKSKFDRVMDQLREYLSENDFERWSRIFNDQAIGDDRIAISNGLVGLKFELRGLYKDIDYLIKERNRSHSILRCESISYDTKLEIEKHIGDLNNLMESYQRILNTLGEVLIKLYTPLLDKYFNKEEIVQIISGSYEKVNEIDDFIEREETGTNSITESYIIHHAEYRWKKGRSKNFIDCPKWEMPLFNCMSNYMLEEIHKNPESSNKMSSLFEEMFPESLNNVTLDSNGNIISIEKVIQEVSIRELVKNYKGNFIKKLRKGNIFSEEKYKIKNLKDNTYCILNEDNKEGEIIYKKSI